MPLLILFVIFMLLAIVQLAVGVRRSIACFVVVSVGYTLRFALPTFLPDWNPTVAETGGLVLWTAIPALVFLIIAHKEKSETDD